MSEDSQTLFVHYTFGLSLIRIIDTVILPSRLTIKTEIVVMDDDRISDALRKVEYWLEEYARSSIAICANNDIGMSMLLDENKSPRMMNSLMVTPYEPTDQHMAVLMQSKLQAIADGAFVIGMVEISSEESNGLTFTYVGDNEDDLPTMEEWITGPTWFERAWWARRDVSMIDTQAPEGADLTKLPAWAHTLDFLDETDENNPEAIVVGFDPKIIEGEKPD